jgi:ATP adenylyltransferase
MDRLWAPWRIKYVKGKKIKKCIFCQSLKNERKNYVIFKTKHSIAMLNIFPYNNGHIMVSPIRHIRDLTLLRDIEALDLIRTLNKAQDLLDKVLKPHGYNIGINLSKAAGAGITGHLHVHIVPRWVGDTNFMPVVHATKIISQSIDELYKQLKNAKSKTD